MNKYKFIILEDKMIEFLSISIIPMFMLLIFSIILYTNIKYRKQIKKQTNQDDDSFRTSNSHNYTNQNSSNETDLINSTTGALMIGGFAGVDTFGNSFGSDVSGGIYND